MKKTNMLLLVAAMAISSPLAFAQFAEKEIVKQIWTCKGDGKGTIDAVNVVVDIAKNSSEGTLYDGFMSDENIPLTLVKTPEGTLNRLSGSIEPGHDNRDYSVQLLAEREEDLYSDENTISGLAVVVHSGFIDCVGTRNGADVLACEVKLEHAANR